MLGYLELRYISPMSNYNFNNNKNLYILVVANTSSNNKVQIYKTTIKNLDNINDKVRGYSIKKAILPLPSFFGETITAKLFSYNKSLNILTLIFSGMIDLGVLEMGGINYIELKRTPNISLKYSGDRDYLNEKFNKLEDINIVGKTYLYISRIPKPTCLLMKPTVIDFDAESETNNLWVFNRYNSSVFKEYTPIALDDSHNKNTKIALIIDYYNKTSNPVARCDALRPLKYQPYINSTITAPTDGKLKSFNINSSLKLISNNKLYTMDSLVRKSHQYEGGSGFISRSSPTDHHKVYMPYSGYLTHVGQIEHEKGEGSFTINLRFESSYFIPADVHERDLLSVVNGNWTYGGAGVGAGLRYWPEVLKKQPDTYLIFSVIIISPTLEDVFKYTNAKTVSQWFEQGEELGELRHGYSNVVFLCNRPMDFTSDIKYYSKMLPDTPLNNKIDTFVRARDIVGIMN